MKEYLYYFGYTDPVNKAVNDYLGTDYESAICIRIFAESPEKAIEWGDQIARKFIKFLYKDESGSCRKDDFISGIESEVNEYVKENWDKVPKVM